MAPAGCKLCEAEIASFSIVVFAFALLPHGHRKIEENRKNRKNRKIAHTCFHCHFHMLQGTRTEETET